MVLVVAPVLQYISQALSGFGRDAADGISNRFNDEVGWKLVSVRYLVTLSVVLAKPLPSRRCHPDQRGRVNNHVGDITSDSRDLFFVARVGSVM